MTVLKLKSTKTNPAMFRKWGLKPHLMIGGKQYTLYDFHPEKAIAQKLVREIKEDGAKYVKVIFRKKAYFESYHGPGKYQGYFDSVYVVYFR